MQSSLWLKAVVTGLIATVLGAGEAGAIGFTFTKIVDTNTPLPGTTKGFDGFSEPAISNGVVVFDRKVVDLAERELYASFFKFVDGELSIIANTNDLLEVGRAIFSSSIAVDQEEIFLSYSGIDSRSANGIAYSPLYADVGDQLTLLLDAGSGILSPNNFFQYRLIWSVQADSGKVLFESRVTYGNPDTYKGLFVLDDGQIETVMLTEDPLPTDSGLFIPVLDGDPPERTLFDRLLDYYITGETVVFESIDLRTAPSIIGIPNVLYEPNIQGVFTSVNGALSTIAAVKFNRDSANECYFADSVLGEDTIAFIDPCGGGLYLGDSSGFTLVADRNTQIPGTTNPFGNFSGVSLDRNNILFGASGVSQFDFYNSSGLYTNLGGELSRVIAAGDLLDGKPVRAVRLTPQALDGDQIVFPVEFEDGSRGIYLAEAASSISEPGAIAGLIGLATLGIYRRKRSR